MLRHHDVHTQFNGMNAGDSPPIVARTVALRYFTPEDAHKVYLMSQESGLRTWLPDQVYEREEQALEVVNFLIEKYRDPGQPALAPYVLAVCRIGSSEVIGHVGLSPLNGQVEIGYAIEGKHHGKGFASQAVNAMSEWALARFSLPRILGIVATDNVASCRVLENAGFELAEEAMGRLHGHSGLVRRYEKVRQVAGGREGDTIQSDWEGG